MSLESGTFRTHRKAFIVEEDTLRRIEGLLNKHASDYDEPLQLVYHVEREDDRFYETHDLVDVLTDPNAPTKRINLLSIALQATNPQVNRNDEMRSVVRIIFDKQDENHILHSYVALKISCSNRTWALLVADEIEPHIQRAFKAKHTPRWLLYLLLIPAMAGAYRLMRLADADKFTPSRGITLILITTISIILLTLVFRLLGIPEWFRKCFGPESVFLWGSEDEAHRDREQFRRNLLWVVIIGFFVSLFASFAAVWF